jgi:predicted phosphodiesterase
MRLGIISDIHEDLDSLKTALDIFSQKQCDELVCLGDILGFDSNFYQYSRSRNASECISIIKSNFKFVVIGNHDLYAIKKIPRQLNGFIYPNNWYELSIQQRRELSHGKIWLYENEELSVPLTESEENFLSNLPEYIETMGVNIKILLSHSVFPDLTGSNFFRLHNPWELRSHFDYLKSKEISFGFSGHMHSKNLMTATVNRIKVLPYKKFSFENSLSQYLCPSIANGKGKSGLIIADINNCEIEAIEINNKFRLKMFSFNGRTEKKY